MMRTNLLIIIAAVAIAAAIALATRDRMPESNPTDHAVASDSTVIPQNPRGTDSATAVAESSAIPLPGASPVTPIATPTGADNGSPAPGAADPTAAAVVRRAADAYSVVRSLKASFVQRTENPLLGQTTTSRGTLYQQRPDRFKLGFSEPAGDVIVSDGRYFWIYYPSVDAKQVMRAPVSAAGAGAVDLQAQFLGDTDRRFTATLEGTANVNGRSAYVVTMVPRENLGYRRLKVWIDTQDHLVRRFEITENNDNLRHFDLSNLEINPEIAASVFRFTVPEGTRIVERG